MYHSLVYFVNLTYLLIHYFIVLVISLHWQKPHYFYYYYYLLIFKGERILLQVKQIRTATEVFHVTVDNTEKEKLATHLSGWNPPICVSFEKKKKIRQLKASHFNKIKEKLSVNFEIYKMYVNTSPTCQLTKVEYQKSESEYAIVHVELPFFPFQNQAEVNQ